MKRVIVRAPVRADLAGGTLDLWPIYLFHPGSRTVNVAISFYAESEVVETGDGAIEIHLADEGYQQRYESMKELSADPKAALIFRVLEHFKVNGISVTTRTDAPRGSGLGGSSALSITLVRALTQIAGIPIDGEDLVFLVRDLETRLLGVPSGIQDYYPPVFGGLASLRLEPGVPVRHPINLPVADLAQHMLLHYTGVAHFSGTNNWEMYKRQIEGKKKVQRGFDKIAATSVEMEKALEAGDFKRAGKALAKEWDNRKALIDGISTPEIDTAIDAALTAGAWGGKVCGAGGGGCIVFLFPPEKREAIVSALSSVPGRVLDVAPVAHGLTIRSGDDDTQSAPMHTRARPAAARSGPEVEQLYVHGDSGEYKPFILAEAVVKHIDGRSGTHPSVIRSYAAPIEDIDGRVLWQMARFVDTSRLDLRVSPDPERRVNSSIEPEVALRTARESEESFRTFLAENERLRIYQNPAFGLFSDPGESRESFLERCVEEGKRRLSTSSEKLESTFRRRIDQLRERSEREDRGREQQEGAQEEKPQDVNVAWGQTLYNITSGRPAAVAEATPSVREVDYLENIAQVQRAWDKEQQTLREDLDAKAREIEEVTLVPTQKNIEITKYLVLWAGSLP